MEKERGIFWLHREEADRVEEVPLSVHREPDSAGEGAEEIALWYLELPVSWSEPLLSVKELTAGPGLDGMIWIYLPDQWKEMCSFLRQSAEKNPTEGRAAIRYFLAAAAETEVKDGKLYLPEYLLRKCGIEEKAVIVRYEKAGRNYYAIRNDDRKEQTADDS